MPGRLVRFLTLPTRGEGKHNPVGNRAHQDDMVAPDAALPVSVPKVVECGVWCDRSNLTVIEAYPSACKRSETIHALRRTYPVLTHADYEDALTCALVASLFAEKRGALMPPEAEVSPSEGWIWMPRDAFVHDALFGS